LKKLSLVIPVYNEGKTLEKLVSKVLAVELPVKMAKELILVDDGSKDNSREIMTSLEKEHPEIRIFFNSKNMGKSQTVKKGLKKTTGDFVIIQDADLEYEPDEIGDLISLMHENSLDVVYGNRFGKKNRVIYLHNYIGNKFLSFISNIFTYPRIRVWIPDLEVCYKLMRGDIARKIGRQLVSTSRFGLEPEITARLSKYKKNGKHLKFGVVPITYNARTISEGKSMNAFKDGTKALWEIVYFNIIRP
jgi:glycosyltransferase involved in cell wall biosynthesis